MMMYKAIGLALTLAVSLGASAQRTHRQNPSPAPKNDEVVIVDDESCGCELVFIDGIQTTQEGDLFGFKRADGSVIVKPQYRFVGKFQNGFCIVMRDYYQTGIINREGKEILPCIYQTVSMPSEGLIRAQIGDRYGFWDTTGHEVIAPTWDATSGFAEGWAVAARNPDSLSEGLYGFIDHSGKIVIDLQYQYAYPFHDGFAVVKQYDRYGLIDRSGKMVMPCKYTVLTSMDMGRCFAMDAVEERLAMFDEKCRQITDFAYEDVFGYGDGLYSVKRNGKFTFLDTKGRERFGEFDEVGSFVKGFCMVKRDGKYGIIDNKGHFVLPIEYDNSGFRSEEYIFFEGLALVEKGGKYGYVDTKGRIVVPLVYSSGYRFTEGIAPVKRNGVWGYIDHKGEMAIPFLFEAASPFEHGRAEVVYNGEVSKINPKGQCVKSCKNFPKFK